MDGRLGFNGILSTQVAQVSMMKSQTAIMFFMDSNRNVHILHRLWLLV